VDQRRPDGGVLLPGRLELKREFLEGELSEASQIALPAAAAIGGMAGPALIYWWLNRADPVSLQGWAIPTATDIAFALGVLALLGPRVPASLKAFLLALAILDDLGAIAIIALVYTEKLSLPAFAVAAAALAVLTVMNRRRITAAPAYLFVGFVLWIAVLKSGVHATLAGVALAFFIPMRGTHPDEPSPLRRLERDLHPAVAYAILPLFAFANAGVSLEGVTLATLAQPVPLGIALGLVAARPRACSAPSRSWSGSASRACPRVPVGGDARRRGAVRHRLHHEPLYRLARLRGCARGVRRADAARDSVRVARCRRSGLRHPARRAQAALRKSIDPALRRDGALTFSPWCCRRGRSA